MDPMREIFIAQTRATRSSQKSLQDRGTSEHLVKEINELLTLDAEALRRQWAKLFDAEPSPLIAATNDRGGLDPERAPVKRFRTANYFAALALRKLLVSLPRAAS